MHFISNIVYNKFLPTNLMNMYECSVYTLLKLQTIINVFVWSTNYMCLIVTCPSVSGYLGFKLGWETDVNSFKLTSRDWFVTSTKDTVRILSSMCTSEGSSVHTVRLCRSIFILDTA